MICLPLLLGEGLVGADLSFDFAQDGELVEPCVCPVMEILLNSEATIF